MPLRYTYLALAILGFVVPYAEFLPFIWNHGLDYELFLNNLFETRISAMFAWDLFISALVLIIFVLTDGRQLGMRQLWAPLLGTLLVGVSFGFPLYLYMRQLQLKE